ncbi:hypothetical protein KTO58_11600 [Chitinophaga pendula]|uniref:hypothetical protein n=1 Tax=Chitinophaga TaxID=79328 RepID=UPI000BAECABA|nr:MULTISPECIES: hypothetical protein [Chitinophaga]ASZ12585.1 hypothetical protein CK934_17295 [Chitinophaga sp. MD30]UCJ09812.1 hypothetical protein KTO58_11600 [Chitinophaga pendula]
MKRRARSIVLWYTLLFTGLLTACDSHRSSYETPAPVAAVDSAHPPSAQIADDVKFRTTLSSFQHAVKSDTPEIIAKYIHFPLQTAPKWFDEDLSHMQIDKSAGKVSASEFKEYYSNIFHADVKRLLPLAGEEDITEIDEKSDEDYYNLLRAETDKGSMLYEIYFQYAVESNNSESYFSFIFGRINGDYKVLAYYGKWPAKI